jgi:predicted HD phosphohydrolase
MTETNTQAVPAADEPVAASDSRRDLLPSSTAQEPQRSPLLLPGWRYIEKTRLADFTRSDWITLNTQRRQYYAQRQADAVLDLLRAGQDEPVFGYQINNFQHCLQSATLVYRDGREEEDVVVALLHDVGFIACPERHGAFAAELLGGYVSEGNYWMLRHHQAFGAKHITEHPDDDYDPDLRERWRGHPHFDWSAEFVERYDVNAVDPAYANAPLDFFEPMVRRIFARTPKPLVLD